MLVAQESHLEAQEKNSHLGARDQDSHLEAMNQKGLGAKDPEIPKNQDQDSLRDILIMNKNLQRVRLI